jgi:hypothetical protein
MNKRFQTLLAGAAVLCGTAVLGAGFGCEDAEAKRRAEVQQQITEARAQFQKASLGPTAPDDDHADQTRRELNRIVSTLQGVTDGAPGQQAAKSLLVAEALSELSLIEYRRIHDIESDHQVDRQIAHNRLLGLQRLAATRQAREAISTEQHRAELAQIRRATDEQLRQLQQQLSRINEPIAELTERNERDQARIDELREQAAEMIRRAEELGPADGFTTFENAIGIQREADLIQFRAAHRELELLLEHQPIKQMTERQVQAAEDLKRQVEQAIGDLESFDALYASAGSTLRDRIRQGSDDLRQTVERISDSMTGDLAAAYSEAADHLERAASQARNAATRQRGTEANAARLIEARANESLGRLYWRQAGGVADHLALLRAIVASDNAIGDAQPYRARIEQFAQQHESLLGQAKGAYTQAKESLTMISGAAAQQVGQYRQNLEMLVAALDGEEVDAWQPDMPQMPDDVAERVDRPRDAARAGAGFESADALVAFLRGMDETNMSDVERMIAATHAETRAGRAYANLMNSMTRSMVDLMAAVEEQFGAAAVAQLSQAAGGGSAFEGITIVDRSETRATASFQPMPSMPDGTLELVNINGQWFIDADSLGDDAGTDPGMEEFAIAMMEQMATAMNQQINELTRRVRAGEFDSIDQFMQTMMQMMMQGQGMPEGMPDMPDEW